MRCEECGKELTEEEVQNSSFICNSCAQEIEEVEMFYDGNELDFNE